jgi:hypothetical protein
LYSLYASCFNFLQAELGNLLLVEASILTFPFSAFCFQLYVLIFQHAVQTAMCVVSTTSLARLAFQPEFG